jgi:hypothetical protein
MGPGFLSRSPLQQLSKNPNTGECLFKNILGDQKVVLKDL